MVLGYAEINCNCETGMEVSTSFFSFQSLLFSVISVVHLFSPFLCGVEGGRAWNDIGYMEAQIMTYNALMISRPSAHG